jgi:hypothetical protein
MMWMCLPVKLGPRRFLPSPLPCLTPAGRTADVRAVVGQFNMQGPGQSYERRPLQVILHSAERNAKHHRDLTAACSTSGKLEHLA